MGNSLKRFTMRWMPTRHYSATLKHIDRTLEVVKEEHHNLLLQVERATLDGNRSLVEELDDALVRIEKYAWRMRGLRQSTIALIAGPVENASVTAPQFGERLLLLILSKDERVNIPGDLEEEYRGIAAKHGARYAKLWYYKQVAASAWPMIRKSVRWGLLAWVEEWIRHRV